MESRHRADSASAERRGLRRRAVGLQRRGVTQVSERTRAGRRVPWGCDTGRIPATPDSEGHRGYGTGRISPARAAGPCGCEAKHEAGAAGRGGGAALVFFKQLAALLNKNAFPPTRARRKRWLRPQPRCRLRAPTRVRHRSGRRYPGRSSTPSHVRGRIG